MNESKILELTYFDTATVKRLQKIKDKQTGVTDTTQNIIYENIKCALSKMDNQPMTSDGVGKLNYSHKLFVSPQYDIKEGDIVSVVSMKKISDYLVSKVFFYPSHSEILLTCKERV